MCADTELQVHTDMTFIEGDSFGLKERLTTACTSQQQLSHPCKHQYLQG
jgi:hypothetical protein